MNSQKGFTLIELIIVIVVLGILAVTAAPQFINFGADAREGTLQKIQASMISASDIIYGKASIDGIENDGIDDNGTAGDTTDDSYPQTDGYDVIYGYPAPTAAGIISALNLSSGDWDIVYSVDQSDPAADPAIGDSVRISPVGRNTDDDGAAAVAPATAGVDYDEVVSCYIEYIGPADADSQPVITIEPLDC